MTETHDAPATLITQQLDGGAVLIDILPRLPLRRIRVVTAAALASRTLERQRDHDKTHRATTTLTARLRTIDLLSRIALLSLRAEASREETIRLDRETFEGIAEAWGRLVGAPVGVRHAPSMTEQETPGAADPLPIDSRRSA